MSEHKCSAIVPGRSGSYAGTCGKPATQYFFYAGKYKEEQYRCNAHAKNNFRKWYVLDKEEPT